MGIGTEMVWVEIRGWGWGWGPGWGHGTCGCVYLVM